MKIKIIQGKKQIIEKTLPNETILDVIRRSDAEILAPCGGVKKCGKCLVKVSGTKEELSKYESDLLGEDNVKNGFRLACFIHPFENMEVTIPEQSTKNKILTNLYMNIDKIEPAVKIKKIKTQLPNLEKQISDLSNIIDSSKMTADINNLDMLKSITEAIANSNNQPTIISHLDIISGVEYKQTKGFYGIAVDIGTTTVAVYLFNLENGVMIDVVSELNSQKQYGADVISRINYATTEDNGLTTLQSVLIKQLNRMTKTLCKSQKIIKDEIYMAVLVGNTTIMHLLMGLNPVNIGKLPFVPVSTHMHDFRAVELGLSINKFARAICLPSVSGYIGADIIAGLIACAFHEQKNISLLVDIGTNGEMVLGNKDRLVSCSTAAGPAFEGANIRFGTGGIPGAIDYIKVENGEISYTTIDGEDPVGICGSGIVDIVAMLLDEGLVEETGRFYDQDEIADHPLSARMGKFEGMRAFRLTENIYVTQKDIREIQNAKAALAAGISTLIKKFGTTPDKISKIYLAGGFGNYINVKSALSIGLLPKVEPEKVVASGNTAGAGAVTCLLSRKQMENAETLKKKVEYIELTTDPNFTDEYIENMIF